MGEREGERVNRCGDSRNDNVVAARFNNNVNSIVAPCQRWETGMYIALKERVNQRVVSCSPIRSGRNDNPVFERGGGRGVGQGSCGDKFRFPSARASRGDFLRPILQCISRGSRLAARRTEEEQAWGRENGTRHSGEQNGGWRKRAMPVGYRYFILFFNRKLRVGLFNNA